MEAKWFQNVDCQTLVMHVMALYRLYLGIAVAGMGVVVLKMTALKRRSF